MAQFSQSRIGDQRAVPWGVVTRSYEESEISLSGKEGHPLSWYIDERERYWQVDATGSESSYESSYD